MAEQFEGDGSEVIVDEALKFIARNTLVWFTSDNGGLPDIDYRPNLPGVHPDSTGHLRGFKKELYEGGIRVPKIIFENQV